MASNQGSRAGLITTVVVLSIVSVVATIFAFWYSAEKRKVDDDFASLKKQYGGVIAPVALSSPEVTDLKNLLTNPDSGYSKDMKVWDVALDQRDQLVKLVTGKAAGKENTATLALKDVPAKLAAANDTVKNADTRLPSTNDDLLGALDVLANKVKIQADALADRDAKLRDAEARALDAVQQKDKDLAARDQKIAEIRAQVEQDLKQIGGSRTSDQGVLADIEKSRAEERQGFQDSLAKKDAEIKAKDQQIKSLEDRMKLAQTRYDRLRPDTTNSLLRRGSGAISGFSGKDIVYINLGSGKQIIPGMTFEVYDKAHGIPKMTDAFETGEQLAGIASIEVTKVLDDSSECRITRRAAGKQIMQGDLILNVAYDPVAKYNFYVFGRFDLDGNGVATLQDTEVVKRLITQWGAKIANKVSVDTDFVVIGKEPVVPTFTSEELTDPLNAKKLTDAQAELDSYLNVVQAAKELRIPILNQNRFVYFTGQESLIGK